MKENKMINWMKEFITNYGWIILVVITAVALITYLDSWDVGEEFNPDKHVCEEIKHSITGDITLIPNILGFDGGVKEANEIASRHECTDWRDKTEMELKIEKILEGNKTIISCDSGISISVEHYEGNVSGTSVVGGIFQVRAPLGNNTWRIYYQDGTNKTFQYIPTGMKKISIVNKVEHEEVIILKSDDCPTIEYNSSKYTIECYNETRAVEIK